MLVPLEFEICMCMLCCCSSALCFIKKAVSCMYLKSGLNRKSIFIVAQKWYQSNKLIIYLASMPIRMEYVYYMVELLNLIYFDPRKKIFDLKIEFDLLGLSEV